uniref:Uncharacterized protein n=1 Tax=Cucumis melo TaxID=3656 RepID=A0A9I9CFQ9_CUCME
MSGPCNHCNRLQNKDTEVNIPGHAEMQGLTCSEFSWNDDAKCIIAEKELFDN